MNERETNVPTELAKLQREVVAFKNSQYIGSDSIRTYTNETSNTWDYTKTLETVVPPFHYSQHLVKFTANSGKIPTAQLKIKAQIDGVNYNPATLETDLTNGYIYADFNYLAVYSTDIYTKPNTLTWLILCQANSAKIFKVKVYVESTDIGEVEIQELGL